jgi:hypothetical protein
VLCSLLLQAGVPYRQRCPPDRVASGLNILRSRLTAAGVLVPPTSGGSFGYLHGLRLACMDVPDFQSSSVVAAQLPTVNSLAVPGSFFRHECPEGSKVVSGSAMLDVTGELISGAC